MTGSNKNKDHGFAHSGSGKLLPKDDPLFEAVGTLDELNGHIGLIISHVNMEDIAATLSIIQKKLSKIMSELAFAPEREQAGRDGNCPGTDRIKNEGKRTDPSTNNADISYLEDKIERLKKESNKITGFVQPGKTKIGAHIHVARTVCRRAERRIVSMRTQYEISNESLAYINKLSEYLFFLSCALEDK